MALYPDIVAAVNAFLPSSVTHTDDAGNEFFGEEHLQDEGAPPRVVWVPMTDAFGPAQQRGSAQGDPRALHTNQASVDVHCWGDSSANALALRDSFILALRAALGPNYHLQRGAWRGQEATTTNLGVVYVLSLSLDIPITDAAPALAPAPNALPTTVSFSPHPGP